MSAWLTKFLRPGVSALVALPCLGCTLALQREEGQCRSHADCQALGTDYVCGAEQICVSFDVQERMVAELAGRQCIDDADCAETLGLALCRAGLCRGLNNADRSCVSAGWGTTSPSDGSRAFVIGMLVPRAELGPSGVRRRVTGAVGTAINEFNRARQEAGSGALPALVGVACDEALPESVEYLVQDLGVNALVGPTDSGRVESMLAQIGERALLWSPFADGPNLQLADRNQPERLISCKANRAGIRAYFLSAVAEAGAEVQKLAAPGLETLSPVLAISGDVATTSFAAGFNALELEAAGLRAIPYTSEPRGRGLVSALGAVTPPANLVIAASAADGWGDNIAAFDRASYDGRQSYPYYLLADKSADVFSKTILDQATADGFPAQYLRFLGLDAHRDDQSQLAYLEFEHAFQGETGALPEPGFEYAYDCGYLAVYAAIAAAQRYSIPVWELPPDAIIAGLGAVQAGGPVVPIQAINIPTIVSNLVSNRGANGSVNLIGASGDLEFEGDVGASVMNTPQRRYLAPRTPDGELYCIDAATKEFCDTGITFPSSGGAARRTAAKCACFRPNP